MKLHTIGFLLLSFFMTMFTTSTSNATIVKGTELKGNMVFTTPLSVGFKENGEIQYFMLKKGRLEKADKSAFTSAMAKVIQEVKDIACFVKPDEVSVEVKGFVELRWSTEKLCAP